MAFDTFMEICDKIQSIYWPIRIVYLVIWIYGNYLSLILLITSFRLDGFLKKNYPDKHREVYGKSIALWRFLRSDELDSDIELKTLKKKFVESLKLFLIVGAIWMALSIKYLV